MVHSEISRALREFNTKSTLSILETKTSGDSTSAAVCVIPSNARVNEQLARELLALRPTLAEHACKLNGLGRFKDKIMGATLPHLVEHIAIDILVEQARADSSQRSAKHSNAPTAQPGAPVFGNTQWLDKDAGVMRVTVSCTTQDSAAVSEAIVQAVELVNHFTD